MAMQVNLQLGGPVPIISIVPATGPRIPVRVTCLNPTTTPSKPPPPFENEHPKISSPPTSPCYPPFDNTDILRRRHDAIARAEHEFRKQPAVHTSPALSAVSEEGMSSTLIRENAYSSSRSDVYNYNRACKSEPQLKRLQNGTQTTFSVANSAQRRAVRLQLAITRTARRWYAAKCEADALVNDLQFNREKTEKSFINRSRYGNRVPEKCDSDASPVLMKRKHQDSTFNENMQPPVLSLSPSQMKFVESVPDQVDILTQDNSPVNSLAFEEPMSGHEVLSSELNNTFVEPVFEKPENYSNSNVEKQIPTTLQSKPNTVINPSLIQCIGPEVNPQDKAQKSEEEEESSVEHDPNESDQTYEEPEHEYFTNDYTTTTTFGANIAPLAITSSEIRAQYAEFREAIGEQVVTLRKADLRMALLIQPRAPCLSQTIARKKFICHTQTLPTSEYLLSGSSNEEIRIWASNSVLRWAACVSVGRRDAAMFHHALNAWSSALEGRVRFKHTDTLTDANILVVRGSETRAFFPRQATMHRVTLAEGGVDYHELLHHVGHLVGLYHSMHIDAIPPLCSSRRRTAVGEHLADISMDDVDALIDAYDTLNDGDEIRGNDVFETTIRTVRRVEPNYK